MGLSTYLTAQKSYYQSIDKDYGDVADALEDILPLDIGVSHNATRNITIEIPIATWHRGYTIDGFLWSLGGEPDSDRYTLDIDIPLVIELARNYADNPDGARHYDASMSEETPEWIGQQFLRLERALTDILLSGKLDDCTLKVWRSY